LAAKLKMVDIPKKKEVDLPQGNRGTVDLPNRIELDLPKRNRARSTTRKGNIGRSTK
jgi:hypothetical protein